MLAEVQEPPKENEQDRLLDIENKVQMFKIATDKINKSMKQKMRTKKLIFDTDESNGRF